MDHIVPIKITLNIFLFHIILLKMNLCCNHSAIWVKLPKNVSHLPNICLYFTWCIHIYIYFVLAYFYYQVLLYKISEILQWDPKR